MVIDKNTHFYLGQKKICTFYKIDNMIKEEKMPKIHTFFNIFTKAKNPHFFINTVLKRKKAEIHTFLRKKGS